MQNHLITEILGLEDVVLKKTLRSDIDMKFFLETKPKPQVCPACGKTTARIHDYRMQTVKDLPFQMNHCSIVLRKRRYACPCGKRFFEKYSFLPKYHQRTARLTAYIAAALHESSSIKSVAAQSGVSSATVNRILDTICYTRPHLGEAISIDEFKGNADRQKFQCILTDPRKHRVLDILPDRNSTHLTAYFRSIPRDERLRVKYFSCDMCKPYVELANAFFPNATVVIDRYHFVRQVFWALENVRKDQQKTMPANLRKYYKRSKTLMLKRYGTLNEEQKKACDLMLLYNDDLRKAHFFKEQFLKICGMKKYSEQREAFRNWIYEAGKSGISHLEKCAKTFQNWAPLILNSFKYSFISNGPTEGFNNKIKVLKRTSYGIRRFDRFRTRILLTTT